MHGGGKIILVVENQRQMTIAIGACYSVLKFRLRYYNDDTPPDTKTLEYFDLVHAEFVYTKPQLEA